MRSPQIWKIWSAENVVKVSRLRREKEITANYVQRATWVKIAHREAVKLVAIAARKVI